MSKKQKAYYQELLRRDLSEFPQWHYAESIGAHKNLNARQDGWSDTRNWIAECLQELGVNRQPA